MSDSEVQPESRPSGYSLLHLIIAALAGAGITILLYATGTMASVSKVASKVSGGGAEIVSMDALRYEQAQEIRKVAEEVAAEQKKHSWEVTADELQKNPKIKSMGLDAQQQMMTLQAALQPPPPNEVEPPKLEGYKPVDLTDPKSSIYNYAVLKQPEPGAPPTATPNVVSFGEEYGNKKLAVYRIEVTPKPQKGPDGKTQPPPPAQTIYFGPIVEAELDKQINMVKAQVDVKKLPIEGSKELSVPARFYSNSEGKLALVIEGKVPHPERVVNRGPVAYYRIPVQELKDYMKKKESDPTKPNPPSDQAIIAVLRDS